MNIEILYQDDFIVVINKPSGLLSVPFEGHKGKTAISMLENMMRKRGTWSKFHRPFAVHRLDRDTSGVMMFALDEKTQKKLMDNWQSCVTERQYVALAENPRNKKAILSEKVGVIDLPLAFNNSNHNSYAVKNIGKTVPELKTVSALTHYKILKANNDYTLFQLELETGRKNQIRAHLSAKGYTIAGDKNYHAKSDPFARLCLHARTLEFVHPVTNEKMKFEVPEPSEWGKLV
mgnify:CR=1 FL=1